MHEIFVEEAKDPTTPIERLKELAKNYQSDTRVAEALLQNPSSPPELLAEVLAKAPLALIQNPAISLLLLENPGLFDRFDGRPLSLIAAHQETPLWLLEALSNRTYRAGSGSYELSYALATNKNSSETLLARLATIEDAGLHRLLAQHPKIPQELLQKFLLSAAPGVRYHAARNSKASQKILAFLHRAGASPWLEKYVDPDPSMTQEELTQLSTMGALGMFLFARHPNAPPARLEELSKDINLLKSLLKNPRLSGHLLQRIFTEKPYLRLPIAQHPNTPPELLARLAADDNAKIREAAARNPSMPPGVLSLFQRAGAAPNLSGFVPADLSLSSEALSIVASYGSWGAVLVARHPNADPTWLSALAQEPPVKNPEASAASLRHPRLPRELLAAFVKDEQRRDGALQNPSLPRELLQSYWEQCARSFSLALLSPLLQNPSLDPAWISALTVQVVQIGKRGRPSAPFRAQLAKDPRNAAEALSLMVNDKKPRVRAALAQNLKTPQETLSLLIEDALPEVRLVAAQNPNTPKEALQKLIERGATPDLYWASSRKVSLTDPELAAMMQRGTFAKLLAAVSCQEKPNDFVTALTFYSTSELPHPSHPEGELRQRLQGVGSFFASASLTQNVRGLLYGRANIGGQRKGRTLLLQRLASEPTTPAPLLEMLSKEHDFHTRCSVAANPNTPEPLLRALSKDKNYKIRRAVQLNTQSPPNLWKSIAKNGTIKAPVSTNRLILRQYNGEDEARITEALWPVFQSNPDYLALDEGKRDFSLEDTQNYLRAELSRPGSRCYLLYRRYPEDNGVLVNRLRHLGVRITLTQPLGEELLGLACVLMPHPREPYPWIGLLLLDARCQGRGFGEEAAVALERMFYFESYREARLAVLQENPRAYSFWRRLGYQEYEEGHHNNHPVWKMRKVL